MIRINGANNTLPSGWTFGAHWSIPRLSQSGYWLLHTSGASVQGKDVGALASDASVRLALADHLKFLAEESEG